MQIAHVRRRLHALEARLPPRVRAFVAGRGRPLLALNRRAVARGAALGVFLGFVIPLGQIPAAVLMSSAFRANALASAAGTLVTNPLTFPPIWAAAYLVGGWLLGALASLGIVFPSVAVPGVEQVPGWLPKIATGLVVLATVASLAAYHVVKVWWTSATRRRWRRRREIVAPAA